MKDTVHRPVHLSVHFSTLGSVPIGRTCALLKSRFGRGQTTVLCWNDPGFEHDSAPKRIRGVVPAQRDLCRRIAGGHPGFRSKQVKKDADSSEELKNYELHSPSCHVFTRRPVDGAHPHPRPSTKHRGVPFAHEDVSPYPICIPCCPKRPYLYPDDPSTTKTNLSKSQEKRIEHQKD